MLSDESTMKRYMTFKSIYSLYLLTMNNDDVSFFSSELRLERSFKITSACLCGGGSFLENLNLFNQIHVRKLIKADTQDMRVKLCGESLFVMKRSTHKINTKLRFV